MAGAWIVSAQLYLFDDARATSWEPFSLTRPAGELVFGSLRQWERACRVWNAEHAGHLASEHLLGFHEGDGPPSVRREDLPLERHRIVLSSRAVVRSARREASADVTAGVTDLFVGGVRVGWTLPPGAPFPSREALSAPDREPAAEAQEDLDGFLLEHPWDLVDKCPDQLREDLSMAPTLRDGSTRRPSREQAILPPNVHRIGDDFVMLGPGVEIEPTVVLDTRSGPIALADGVSVRGAARLAGPLHVERNSTILGGSVSASFIGPACKIRGEVERCIFLGYDNKAHDGYLGNAYVGRWVNLGALTTNSDLKNNYGEVRMRTSAGDLPTGLMKVGCFLGDHVKTGIGTLINTGTVVGAGSNLFGGEMPPKYVPPFRWGTGASSDVFRLDRFLETAERAMGRRGVELTPAMRSVLERAWHSATAEGGGQG